MTSAGHDPAFTTGPTIRMDSSNLLPEGCGSMDRARHRQVENVPTAIHCRFDNNLSIVFLPSQGVRSQFEQWLPRGLDKTCVSYVSPHINCVLRVDTTAC
ncbi:hypothetical protein Bxe_B1930 [Paraburkholderia xenovorans LB400]|uniref:Uncharacterized protein n=1 Tax=Paraburkholderia xenovorans (strain LB400) TaxID=266265 RepID=Q13PE5_PARXL|nr:hypothetical protein Bxe_B1930 [Paraburkholderia xenovorans LB400]